MNYYILTTISFFNTLSQYSATPSTMTKNKRKYIDSNPLPSNSQNKQNQSNKTLHKVPLSSKKEVNKAKKYDTTAKRTVSRNLNLELNENM